MIFTLLRPQRTHPISARLPTRAGVGSQRERDPTIFSFQRRQSARAAGPDAYNASGRNGFGLDDNVYQSLLQNRIIFLGSEVKDENANAICAQMLLLNAEDPHKDIYLYINSPGGSVDSGMAIYDTMKWISNDVATVAIGLAASMGQFLLCAGTKGKRYALPHSRIMMHQPSGGLGGTASDIRIQAEQSLHIKSTMQKLIAEHTGQTLEQIEATPTGTGGSPQSRR